MPVINLRETIDPVLAEHYPGLGIKLTVHPTRDAYLLTTADGRSFEADSGPVESALRDVADGWRALFKAIDKAVGPPEPA